MSPHSILMSPHSILTGVLWGRKQALSRYFLCAADLGYRMKIKSKILSQMSLLRCEVIKIAVHTRVKSIILVLHYALTEVSACNHSIHTAFEIVASWMNFTTVCKLSESLP